LLSLSFPFPFWLSTIDGLRCELGAGRAGVTGKSLEAELAVEPLLGVRTLEIERELLPGRILIVVGRELIGFEEVEGSGK